MAEQTLIDQALAVVADAQPVGFSDSIPISPKQAMVWGVYLAEQQRIAGRDTEAAVEKYAASARSVGIEQHEIDAAIEAARA